MKKKVLSLQKYQGSIQSDEKLSFGEKLPFEQITSPKTTIFTAWHGPLVVLTGSTGTCYTCRIDDDLKPLNFDVYSIRPTGDSSVLEIITSPKQNYHWAEDIPKFIKKFAPTWVLDKTREALKNSPDRDTSAGKHKTS